MRILLVDDDTSTRRLIHAMLEKMGHQVVHASDGVEAWGILQHDRINFVLSDWRMPQMDGVELCRRLRSRDDGHYTYVVLFTGSEHEDDMIVAMQAGADDFLTKPVRVRELEVRIQSGQRVLQLEETLKARNQQLSETNKALEISQQRIQSDLKMAAAIQQELLPKEKIDALAVDLAWDFMPAEELAGDVFNFFALDDEHLGFYLADVCGHGVPAAMLSVHVARLLSAEPRPDSIVRLSEQESSRGSLFSMKNLFAAKGSATVPGYRQPKEVAARLNARFDDDPESILYFTMIYGVLNTCSGMGSLCQAGHPYPMICRADGQVERIGSGGLPVGLMPDADYQQFVFELQPGDRLLVYSDGITECQNSAGECFGEDRLAECMSGSRLLPLHNTIKQVNSSLAAWQGNGLAGNPLKDDASMLAIELPDPTKH